MINAAKGRRLMPGWYHTDPELLVAQRQGSGGEQTVHRWVEALFPHLDGLLERLRQPTTSFLDVGTGVATIAIAMCRLFPTLHAVGLEPQKAPMTEARRNIVAAGLGDRIELRAQGIEDVADEDLFDLVWLPQVFLSYEILECALHTTWRALHPGGWAILLAISAPGMKRDAALLRLRNVLWGGAPLYPDQLAHLLVSANFSGVQIIPMAPGSLPHLVVGRRPVR